MFRALGIDVVGMCTFQWVCDALLHSRW